MITQEFRSAASTWSTTSGALTLTAAAASTWGTSTGALTLSGASGINFQNNGTTTASIDGNGISLAAGKAISASAGSGALSLGSMTGDTALPTGSLSWSGAVGKSWTLTQAASSTTGAYLIVINGGAHTSQTSESNDVNINLARTVTFTGNVPTQRAFVLQAPTYAGSGATRIIGTAATLAITGAPTQGASATLTNAYAVWVQAGTTKLEGPLNQSGGVLTLTGSTTASNSVGDGTSTSSLTLSAGSGGMAIGTNNGDFQLTCGTGTMTIGGSTASNTIFFGNGTTVTSATQSINIGSGGSSGAGLTSISIGAGSGRTAITVGSTGADSAGSGSVTTVRAGSGGMTLDTSAANGAFSLTTGNGNITVGSSASTGSISIGTSVNTYSINIGFQGNNTGTQTINIGHYGTGGFKNVNMNGDNVNICSNANSKLGFFNKATATGPRANTGGNVSAPATYTSTAQSMLDDAYKTLQRFGLLTGTGA